MLFKRPLQRSTEEVAVLRLAGNLAVLADRQGPTGFTFSGPAPHNRHRARILAAPLVVQRSATDDVIAPIPIEVDDDHGRAEAVPFLGGALRQQPIAGIAEAGE